MKKYQLELVDKVKKEYPVEGVFTPSGELIKHPTTVKMQLFKGWTQEELNAWLEQHGEPDGCDGCGAIAGVCQSYPNCPGNPEWEKKNVDNPSTSA